MWQPRQAWTQIARQPNPQADALMRVSYDPRAGAALCTRTLVEEKARPYQKQMILFSTHPPSDERLDGIYSAPGPRQSCRRAGPRAFSPPPQLAGRRLAQRRYASPILLMGNLLIDAPEADGGLPTFRPGEVYRKRAGPGDKVRAAAYHAQAISLPDTPAVAWREHGYAMQEASQGAAARTALARYLSLAPDAEDRARPARLATGRRQPMNAASRASHLFPRAGRCCWG